MLDGLVYVYNDLVYCIEGFDIIVCNEEKLGKVVFIFGGGSGYEFLYVGFVGEGMLFVVVCGVVFIFLIFD